MATFYRKFEIILVTFSRPGAAMFAVLPRRWRNRISCWNSNWSACSSLVWLAWHDGKSPKKYYKYVGKTSYKICWENQLYSSMVMFYCYIYIYISIYILYYLWENPARTYSTCGISPAGHVRWPEGNVSLQPTHWYWIKSSLIHMLIHMQCAGYVS